MSQHDQVLANAAGATFRADANSALAALFSNSSGATEPSTTVAFQPWADTANDLLKIRNAANTDWVSILVLSTGRAVANAALAGSASQSFSASTLGTATTIGVGGATPAVSGAGVTFPATQSASSDANTLDDYEEGTWTPSLGGDTTYTVLLGQYTKIGRVVHITGVIIVNVLGTGSTTVVTGLPFTSANSQIQGGGVTNYSGVATSVAYLASTVGAAEAQITMRSTVGAATAMGINAIFASGARVDFDFYYHV